MPMPSTPPPASSFQGLGNDPAGMLDAGTSRGDFVTRTWQPTPAPDSVAVEALMLGPLAKDVGGALAGMKTSVGASGSRPTEDDGLIVRQRPRARADNIARRKQRAAQEDRPDDWFDPEDGGLRCQADPVPPGAEHARPARWFDAEAPYLQTVPSNDLYLDADPTALADGGAAGGIAADRAFRLEVRAGRLEFACHPLMGREDHLAAQLEEAFRSYKRREAAGLDQLYAAKSEAAAARAQALRQEMAAGAALWLAGVSPQDRLAALEEETEEARRLAVDERERAKGAVAHMVDLHVAIEKVRAITGARSTGIRLVVRPKPGGAAGETEPVLSSGGSRDEGPDVPKPEQRRRAKAADARFCVALEVNGRQVPGASAPQHLRGTGSFSLEVAHTFSLSVSRWPDSARLLLFEMGQLMDTFIAAIPVALPGASADEPLADAVPRQYQFSAESPFTPSWEQPGEERAAGVVVGKHAPSIGSTQQYTSGSLFVACAWVPAGVDASARFVDAEARGRAALAPPPPPSTAARRAAAAAKVGYADAPGGFGKAAPPPSTTESLRATGATSLRASLDPLNPDDAALLETIVTRDAVRAAGGGGFRLNQNDEMMLGYTAKASKRQQLLKLRAQGEDKVKLPEGGVPLTDGDIPDDLLDQNLEEQREHMLLTAQLPGLAEADARATRIADFLHRVKMNVAKGRRQVKAGVKAGQGPMHTDDVVKDLPLPEVTFNFSGLFDFMRPVRKLRPVRRRAAPAESHPDHCELVINIQKAFNLPQRAARYGGGGVGGSYGGRQSMDAGRRSGNAFQRAGLTSMSGGMGGMVNMAMQASAMQESPELAVFVEVTFQGTTLRTRLASGSSPSWQESINLTFRPPGGDYSPAALQGCPDVVHIVLFDERIEPAERTYGVTSRGGDETTTTSRHYLGCVDVPVAALYRADQGKLEGVLPIDQPPVLLGYDAPPAARGGSVQARPALSVYIQFSPALAKPEPVPSDAGPGEDDALLRHAKNWEKDARGVSARTKQRPYRAVATDAMGRSVFLPRYCAPATLPPGFEGASADEPTLRQLLRFCHLVPHVSDMDAFNLPPGTDIWTTSSEFLDMCAGDSEEHALLLLGFLLALGVEAYVILGVSATDSDAAMVFTPGGQGRRPGAGPGSPPVYCPMLEEALIWDPMAGTMFGVYDSAAGALMGEVAVAFNADNVWANVQAPAKPHEMGWNLNDASAWRPFFSPTTMPHRTLPTVQTVITYESFAPAFYERLGAAVEREAMDAIVKTRQRQHTPFNRRASRALKELLKSLEGHVLMSPEEAAGGVAVGGGFGRASLTELHAGQLAGVADGYAVTGCPINLPFCDSATIREAVKRTCIAETTRSDVEFAVATHVEPYGCTFVCSAWVYVARLTKHPY